MAQEFDDRGWKMVQQSQARRRVHDVTLVITEGRDRTALLARHSHPPGFFSNSALATPTQGDFILNAETEVKAETGLSVKLENFLLQVTLDIRHGDDLTSWDTYVSKPLARILPPRSSRPRNCCGFRPPKWRAWGRNSSPRTRPGYIIAGGSPIRSDGRSNMVYV